MNVLESVDLNFQAAEARQCPWCDSFDTSLVHRGYTGPTDEVNQYFTCNSCHKVTYELIAKTAREMRLGRFRAGGIFRDQIARADRGGHGFAHRIKRARSDIAVNDADAAERQCPESRAGLFFAHDPAGYQLELGAESYQEP